MKLRMPEAMRDRIAEAAKTNNRSMNAEIVARLETSLSGGKLYTEEEHKRFSDIGAYAMLNVLYTASKLKEMDIKWLIEIMQESKHKELLDSPKTSAFAKDAAARVEKYLSNFAQEKNNPLDG